VLSFKDFFLSAACKIIVMRDLNNTFPVASRPGSGFGSGSPPTAIGECLFWN
jgi:hypothetical protein